MGRTETEKKETSEWCGARGKKDIYKEPPLLLPLSPLPCVSVFVRGGADILSSSLSQEEEQKEKKIAKAKSAAESAYKMEEEGRARHRWRCEIKVQWLKQVLSTSGPVGFLSFNWR